MRAVATDPAKRPGDILVIDDDAILRDLVTDWLEGAGYRVRRAANCCAGTAELGQNPPALIVSDMFMPGPCGAEEIAWLKREHPGVVQHETLRSRVNLTAGLGQDQHGYQDGDGGDQGGHDLPHVVASRSLCPRMHTLTTA